MRTDRVAVVTTNLFEVGRPFETHAAHRRIQARLSSLPQVESTAMVSSLPMRSNVSSLIAVPGKDLFANGPLSSDSMPGINGVDPAFFAVMGMRLVDGRLFTGDENRAGAAPVAVISESMARAFWPGERAVGKCFSLGGPDARCIDVIGIVADARLAPSIRPTRQWASACYLPIEQYTGSTSRALLVRTHGDAGALTGLLRGESQRAAPDLPYVDAHRFDDIFDNLLRPWRLGSIVFVLFGAVSSLIAALGLAVVGAHAVTRRTREIGIRSALGAAPRQLVRLLLGRSLAVVAGGLAIGLTIAFISRRLLQAQLFDVAAGDPRVLAATTASLLAVAGLAAWLPARRAAQVDPIVALRTE